jgi:hypothetical protein
MKATLLLATALALPIFADAQSDSVTLTQTEDVSQTSPAPDCSGLGGFNAGVCASERQAAQTPVTYRRYTLKGDHSVYVLSCRLGSLRGHCPVLLPGQHFTLSTRDSQVILHAPGSKDLKLQLVAAKPIESEKK